MKDASICHICLRTDREPRVLDEALGEFLDDICDYAIAVANDQPKYCSGCEHSLKQFYEFRKKCVEAIKILKQWKKSKPVDREPLSNLYKLLPKVDSLCNEDNKIYDEIGSKPEGKPNCAQKTCNFIGGTETSKNLVDVCQSNDKKCNKETNDTKYVKKRKRKALKQEAEVKLENVLCGSVNNANYLYEENAVEFVSERNEDHDRADSDSNSAGCWSDASLNSNDDVTDSDSDDYNDDDDDVSDEELISPEKPKRNKTKKKDTNVKNKKAINELKRPTGRRKAPFCIEKLKRKLANIFGNCKEIKSTDGTVIESDVILNNVENFSVSTMKNLFKLIKCSETSFTAKALNVLATLQKRFESKYDSIFDIEYLNSKEQVLEEFMKRKTYECYVTAQFKCELCVLGFKFAKMLEYHKETHEPSAGDITCTLCQVRVKTKRKLVIHNQRSHRTVFRCKLCPLITYCRRAMANHANQHQGVRYGCDKCSAVFKSCSALQSHLRRHKTEHACPFCAKTFVSDHGLEVHRYKKHKSEVLPAEEGVLCEACNIKFISTDVYEEHRRITHNELGYKKRDVRKRRNSNAGLTCRVCEATGSSPIWMSKHMRTEHPERQRDTPGHLCDVCGRGFSCKSILEQHRNVHTGARPFTCDKCPAAFHTSQTLYYHAQRHLPPRFQCKECGKRFLSSANLYTHMRIHIGDRRFKCDACAAAFLHRSALNAHVRGVHCQQRRVKKPPHQQRAPLHSYC